MAIRRGVLYAVPTFRRALGIVVLTNDQWNEAATLEVSGALVFPEAGPGRTAIPDLDLYAGPLLRVEKDDLGAARVELGAEQVARVELAITELLGLPELLSAPARRPPSQPGPIDYPRWSNVYYAGEPVGDPPEKKRYVVVSHDQYNRALGGAVFVRTTTSGRGGGTTIPTLGDGVTKAVCVLPTFYTTHSAGTRESRPRPAQLFLPDMVTIAAGIREALVLP